MLDLLAGGFMVVNAGLIAAGVFHPDNLTVAIVYLAIGLSLFTRGLVGMEKPKREPFGKTIDEYRAYKKHLRDRNG